MLPREHPERAEARLGAAMSALERGDQDAAAATLRAYMDEEEERIVQARAKI